MNFGDFQRWREQCLQAAPDLMDCGETNLYRSLAPLRPKPDASGANAPVHRCDLARAWLARYGFAAGLSRRALVCRGVRHALDLIFQELARASATLWMPGDVYPVYAELARRAAIEPRVFATMPEPIIPAIPASSGAEYLLIANPWKPLGRFLSDAESGTLSDWLAASPHRHLIMDCVYDLGAPFHATTHKLLGTGRAILLHSITKGWLWPATFGIALMGESHAQFEAPFRNDPPTPDQLRAAQGFLSTDAGCPDRVISSLQRRAEKLFAALPGAVCRSLLVDRASLSPGSYHFAVRIGPETLLREHRLLAVPGTVFGGEWSGSILTSLSAQFAPVNASCEAP